MKTNNIVFNNKIYSFDSNTLNQVFERLVYNEQKDDEEKKCIISFLTQRFGMKTYEELDYHEFLIEGSFRVSQLLCNIANVFGDTVKSKYVIELTKYLEEDVSETDWFTSLSTSGALFVARQVFTEDQQLVKFKELLATMYLYECSRADFEQTIEDSRDFENLEFVNGIGVRKEIEGDKIILKPVHQVFDVPIEKYIKAAHILIPPAVLNVVFRTVKEGFFDSEKNITVEDFFHKFEQLTGCSTIRKVPIHPKPFVGGINPDIVGKWYRITKSSGFMAMYHINIDWFREDGVLLRSVSFVQRTDEYKDYENWGPKSSKWLANDTEMLIQDGYSKKDVIKPYFVNDNGLKLGDSFYYRSYDEASENVEIYESPY